MGIDLASPPRLADGVELLGEMKDSGFAKPPALVRRADGQMIQMSPLLYLVACRIDGTRAPDAIAALVSDDLGRSLSASQVSYVITDKLAPLGLLAGGAAKAALPTASPLFALRARATLLPAAASNGAGALFRPLFHWPVIVAVITGGGIMDYWLFSSTGCRRVPPGTCQPGEPAARGRPVHRLRRLSRVRPWPGAATAVRSPGADRVGIYLVWPSFFTDVTDSYRLGHGRLRTDLGGVYFNLIFMLGLAGCYAVTDNQVLLLTIAITHLEMLEQLLPFVRFDGYFILSDLLSPVPDPFARIGPVLGKSPSLGDASTRGNAALPGLGG